MFLSRVCGACGEPGPIVCAACSVGLCPAPDGPPPPGLDRCTSVLGYEGTGRDLVIGLKYRNRRAAARPLAGAMAALVGPQSVDVVTWAPTSPQRRRHRGFDQARVLAIDIGRQIDAPCRDLLWRHPGHPQTGRDRHDRCDGPTFGARHRLTGTVLVVDDVITTGATLTAAALALRAAGATSVHAVTAARTPLKVTRRAADNMVNMSRPSGL
jgi:competence protein ComFC